MMVPHSRQSKLEVVVHEKQPLVLKTVTGWSHGWSKLCTGRGALSVVEMALSMVLAGSEPSVPLMGTLRN
jgi:hypothetical protein